MVGAYTAQIYGSIDGFEYVVFNVQPEEVLWVYFVFSRQSSAMIKNKHVYRTQ